MHNLLNDLFRNIFVAPLFPGSHLVDTNDNYKYLDREDNNLKIDLFQSINKMIFFYKILDKDSRYAYEILDKDSRYAYKILYKDKQICI